MKKILIVCSEYYPEISNGLKISAVECLKNYEVLSLQAPGVFEIPVIISRNIDNYDACLALGCVIKGETPHFDYISAAAINAIMTLSINSKKPIGNGILTCLNKAQALNRIEKGAEAANAVIKVLTNER